MQKNIDSVQIEALNTAFVRQVRTFDDTFDNPKIPRPAGLAFLPVAEIFLTISADTQSSDFTEIIAVTSLEEDLAPAHSVKFPADIQAINTAFDSRFNRLLGLNPGGNKLIEVKADSNRNLDPSTQREIDIGSFSIKNAQGITIGPDGTIYVLDGAAQEIVRIEPKADGSLEGAIRSQIALPPEVANPQGIAFDWTTSNLSVLSVTQQELFELSQQGEIVAIRDLSSFGIRNPEAMLFAPSGDRTDAPNQLNLYIADSAANSAGIVELSFVEPQIAANESPDLSLNNQILPAKATDNAFVRQARTFDDLFDNPKIARPTGLTFLPDANIFLTLSADTQSADSTDIIAVASREEELAPADSLKLPSSIQAINTAFDSRFNRLLGLNPSGNKLIEVKGDSNRNLNPGTQKEIDISSFGIKNARGITIGPDGTIYILDGAAKEIIRIESKTDGSLEGAKISRVAISREVVNPRGIAFNSTTGNLHILSVPKQELFELSQKGEVVAIRDLSPFGIRNPESIVFAPSGDQTDKPDQLSLYVADSAANSAGIVELSFVEPPILQPESLSLRATASLPLVQTIDLSQFSPPSPDPAGIAYIGSTNTLLISDSEVNETPLFTGDNLFESTLNGSLLDTLSTTSFSNEPTGVTYNPANEHLFIADDNADEIFEVDPGADGLYDTADDIVTSFDTRAFGSFDPEGIAFASGLNTLFIADGVNSEVYQVTTNGTLVSNFDTFSLGVADIEGIVYNSDSGNLYIIGNPIDSIAEVTTSGTLVDTLDISAANLIKPAGVTLGQNSQNPAEISIYITDRGIDNNADPNENDGKLYEFSLGAAPPPTNQSPVVNTGADQTITDFSIFLDAIVTDDGLPNPPAALTYTWSQISGPGTATFADPNAEDTTINFSNAVFGEYVLRLEVSDGELLSSDEVTVTITEPSEFSTIYVSSSSNGSVDGISFRDEDILAFDTATQTWSLYIDGSDVGLGVSDADIGAFHLNTDGSILLSVNRTFTLPDVGSVDENDIVRFIPTSTGSNTAGTYEWYLDGSDVDLTGGSEDIDAIGFTPDDRLLVSTKGSVNVTGVSAKDEDLLIFNATTLGESTSGSWELYMDSSDVALGNTSSEDINATWIDNNGDIYLSTSGAFNVIGVTGDSSDIFTFTPGSLGANTSGTFESFWDGSQNGLGGERVDGLFLA